MVDAVPVQVLDRLRGARSCLATAGSADLPVGEVVEAPVALDFLGEKASGGVLGEDAFARRGKLIEKES